MATKNRLQEIESVTLSISELQWEAIGGANQATINLARRPPRKPSVFRGDEQLPRHQLSKPRPTGCYQFFSRIGRSSREPMGRDDMLSTLPDDILVNILDRLNVPDAARTSILSRRSMQLRLKQQRAY